MVTSALITETFDYVFLAFQLPDCQQQLDFSFINEEGSVLPNPLIKTQATFTLVEQQPSSIMVNISNVKTS